VGFFSNQQVESMEESIVTNYSAGSRFESRTILDKYFSVQFSLNGMGPTYLFKLRDISLNGICILVKEDSAVLKHLKVCAARQSGEYEVASMNSKPKVTKLDIGFTGLLSKTMNNHFLRGG